MKILVEIPSGNDQQQRLILAAYMVGFKRENPRSAWTEKEMRMAFRFMIEEWIKQTAVTERKEE